MVCALNELVGDTVLVSANVLLLGDADIVCEGWSCKHMTEVLEDVTGADRVGVTWVGSGGSTVKRSL